MASASASFVLPLKRLIKTQKCGTIHRRPVIVVDCRINNRRDFGRNGAQRLLISAQQLHHDPSYNFSCGNGSVSATADQKQQLISDNSKNVEEHLERMIFNCRFFTLFAVFGSLAGALLCFVKGSTYIAKSFIEYFQNCHSGVGSGKVILLLVEAVDVYLVGTVMLIFGMGLYELFVASLDVPGGYCMEGSRTTVCGSNLFGLFRLRERPKWLEIRSLDELKTKLGHVIVMVLLVGMFEKSKKIPVTSSMELLFFSTSILLSSCCLYLLSKLHH
ncbi:uncharacterized protein LOC112345764 [Selaginella moellendorffii]|uniref:uncharacterized protein LOC112345764 n=1 Tax=Selaginella moellendorffii TaxID=88036 RepID=UPI000D1CA50B|nr:uncharacterized protein LOC112345764 [Selaginella moellendorffii]|eukprot:XP_024528876.1 uncharacterized protein LOC112345764 [Selaginella moellendorffii]